MFPMTIKMVLYITAVLLLLAGCTPGPRTQAGRVVVAVVDGHAVEPFEYYVYLGEQKRFFEATGGIDIWYASFGGTDAQTQAKLNALRQLALVRTTAEQAYLAGLVLDAAALAEAETSARAHIAALPASLAADTGSTLENILPVMQRRQLFEAMYEEVTRNFMVSQADFEHFFEGYVLNNPNAVQTVATVAAVNREGVSAAAPRSAAYAVRTAMSSPDGIGEDHGFGDSVSVTVTRDLANSGLPAGVIAAAAGLGIDQVSPILQTADTYYIIRIDAHQVANVATLASSALEEYTKLMRDEIFARAYQGWRDGEPEISINHEVFDTITINDLRPDLSASID